MTQERVLAALGVVALVLLVGGVAALAVGGGDDTAVRSRSASTTSTAIAAPVSSTSSPATDGETTVTVGIICAQPEEAAEAFVDGWRAGDRAAAERCGSAEAVATMFETDGAAAQYTFQGCDRTTDPGVPVCSFTYPGGAAQLTIEGTEAAGWRVTRVTYTAD